MKLKVKDMRKNFFSIIIILILLPALLLQGCWLPIGQNSSQAEAAETPELPEPPEPPEPQPEEPPVQGQFTLRYEPEFTMNPIRALNRDNILLGSLLYESLFILSEDLTAVPLLCARWETEDYEIFIFEILPNIAMHDGSVMTADDVAYSIRQSSNNQRSRHRNKLHMISNVESDGDLTVTITLSSPNARFTRLLDVPIIRSGTFDDDQPPGTGPFVFTFPGAMRLNRFSNYRHYSELPLSFINLIECSDSDLTQLFDSGELSLLWDDPVGAFDIRLNRPHEPRLYNTTALQYLGFNATSRALQDPDVRRAIGCAIERQHIVDNIMNVPRPGQAVAAPVAISPMFDMYDTQWEQRDDLLREMGALLERAGLMDYFNDSFLAMPDGLGGFTRFTLEFIVNIENAHKRAAAHRIAESLRQFGFDITVRELQWGDFMTALREGRFDMYYGETLLGADFDFSPLLLPGDGNLNFGRTGNTVYIPLIQDFLAARTQEEVSQAGEILNLTITQYAPFVPILYKRYAIYSHMGAIMGAAPSQSGVFHNFQDWTIDLYRLY
jgi:ABC-type transport system substrate-binding protein